MDKRNHVTDTTSGPSAANTNASETVRGWSLTARLGRLLFSVAFTKHGDTAQKRASAIPALPRPSELHPLQPNQLWTGDPVLWHQEDGSVVQAEVAHTCSIAGVGSRGQRVKVLREDYVWASELELDPVRGMSTERERQLSERLGDRPAVRSARR